jgi:hypothetical protein
MFSTNINPYSFVGSGLGLPAGQPRQFYARAFADEVVSLANGVWLEVTDDAPTPAALRPHASTITDGTGTAAGEGVHTTLYYTGDPRLESGNTILVRFWVGNAGIKIGYIDTQYGDPTIYTQWFNGQGSSTAFTTAGSASYLLANATSSTPTLSATSATTFSNGPWRALIAVYDDMLIVACFSNQVNLNFIQQFFMVHMINNKGFVPSGHTINAFCMLPIVWAYNYTHISSLNVIGIAQNSDISPTAQNALLSAYTGSFTTFNTLVDGRQMIQPCYFSSHNIRQIMPFSRVRRISGGFKADLDVMELDGDPWLYFDNGGHPILIKFAD